MYYLCTHSNNINKKNKHDKMKKQQAQAKLEKKGYKVSATMQGLYVATKGQQKYVAETINGLIKLIF